MSSDWKKLIKNFDERRDIAIPGNKQATIAFCVEHFIYVAQQSIALHGKFAVALSGGSTPKAIYSQLASEDNRNRVDWEKVLLFWSDERAVPPESSESNYRMAMESGFGHLPLLEENIFRMQADEDLEKNALDYEKIIKKKLPNERFDLVMLGMGEDGHIASLFPQTHGLHARQRLVIANYIPQKNSWRMTLTFDSINQGRHIVVYVLGKDKAAMLDKIFHDTYQPDLLPAQRVGTVDHKALWILDQETNFNEKQK